MIAPVASLCAGRRPVPMRNIKAPRRYARVRNQLVVEFFMACLVFLLNVVIQGSVEALELFVQFQYPFGWHAGKSRHAAYNDCVKHIGH
jgi:hypothetical protein